MYQHFLLYYGQDIQLMRDWEIQKRRSDGEIDGTTAEENETLKHATRKTGYSICAQYKLGRASIDLLSFNTCLSQRKKFGGDIKMHAIR